MPQAKNPSSTTLPSISTLGQLIQNEWDQVHWSELLLPNEKADAQTRIARAYEMIDALGNLALLLPAKNLADAAVQVKLGSGIVNEIDDFKFNEDTLREHNRKLRRVMVSILPVICDAAGLSVSDIAGEADEFAFKRAYAREFDLSRSAAKTAQRAASQWRADTPDGVVDRQTGQVLPHPTAQPFVQEG